MNAATKLLDCGHDPSPHSEHTTGTAHTQDGREICWTCADAEHVLSLLTDTDTGGYFNDERIPSRITTWTGGNLMSVRSAVKRAVGFGGERWYLRAVDAHGQSWHGTSPGPGMYARMRRSKGKAR